MNNRTKDPRVLEKRLADLDQKIQNALYQSRRWNNRASDLIADRDALREAMKPKDEAQHLAARAVEWLCTPEGQESMRKAAADNSEFIEALKKSRHIPWEKLHEPFTI